MARTRQSLELAPVLDRGSVELVKSTGVVVPVEVDALELAIIVQPVDHDDADLVFTVITEVAEELSRTWRPVHKHRIRGGPVFTDNGLPRGDPRRVITKLVRDRWRLAPHPSWCAGRRVRFRVAPNKPVRFGLVLALEREETGRVR